MFPERKQLCWLFFLHVVGLYGRNGSKSILRVSSCLHPKEWALRCSCCSQCYPCSGLSRFIAAVTQPTSAGFWWKPLIVFNEVLYLSKHAEFKNPLMLEWVKWGKRNSSGAYVWLWFSFQTEKRMHFVGTKTFPQISISVGHGGMKRGEEWFLLTFCI